MTFPTWVFSAFFMVAFVNSAYSLKCYSNAAIGADTPADKTTEVVCAGDAGYFKEWACSIAMSPLNSTPMKFCVPYTPLLKLECAGSKDEGYVCFCKTDLCNDNSLLPNNSVMATSSLASLFLCLLVSKLVI